MTQRLGAESKDPGDADLTDAAYGFLTPKPENSRSLRTQWRDLLFLMPSLGDAVDLFSGQGLLCFSGGDQNCWVTKAGIDNRSDDRAYKGRDNKHP